MKKKPCKHRYIHGEIAIKRCGSEIVTSIALRCSTCGMLMPLAKRKNYRLKVNTK